MLPRLGTTWCQTGATPVVRRCPLTSVYVESETDAEVLPTKGVARIGECHRHVINSPQVEFDSRRLHHFILFYDRDRDEWGPARPTVVHVGTVAFGLKLFETTKGVETVWIGSKKAVESLPPRDRQRYGSPSTSTVPSGLLALATYSPYPNTSWHREWRESSAGGLHAFFNTITRELESAAPVVADLVSKAERKAELERLRREEESRIWRRQEVERRRAQANKQSRDQLLAAIEEWAQARRVAAFLQHATKSAAKLQGDERVALMARVERARVILGETDALARLRAWQSLEEIYPPQEEQPP